MYPESYHTQHAPLGAFASFTLGLAGSGGGFGQSLKGPARQNVYVGCREAGEAAWKLLPFFAPPKNAADAFLGEGAAVSPRAPTHAPCTPGQVRRRLGLGTDTWEMGALRFRLLTPLRKTPDPETADVETCRHCFAPLVMAELEYDNRAGSGAVELIFGIGEPHEQVFPLSAAGLAGFTGGGRWGYAASPESVAELRQGFDLFVRGPRDHRGLSILGGESGLVFHVAAGEHRCVPIILAFFQESLATTGVYSTYGYTRWFSSLSAVLGYGLAEQARIRAEAEACDARLESSGLDAERRFLVAQSVHSYLGSTQLLDSGGRLVWVVNEGEYRMINTFDLTVDHLFLELDRHPWAVRNVLELFAERYCYTDRIKSPDGREAEGGVSFTHDMGVGNYFTEAGRSSYECDNETGCFSHMTMEQLCNWILCACSYAWRTEDWGWLARRAGLLGYCAESLERRDDPEPGRRTGILKWDTCRCGTGSEITTYDSLDASLGQARNNLYISVKALGAWMLLARSFERLNVEGQARRARLALARAKQGIAAQFDEAGGFFPAVFEGGNRSRIIPAVEGLAYAAYLGFDAELESLEPLRGLLGRHLASCFQRGVCLDARTGAWKLSSTSRNTWFSKIALNRFVLEQVFPECLSPEALAADAVHAAFQRGPGCGPQAMCDQILSDTGEACGSRFYPRGVTSWLWLPVEGAEPHASSGLPSGKREPGGRDFPIVGSGSRGEQ